jgi:hypothetical protein
VSHSNVVYLPTRLESKKQPTLASRNGFASPREIFELLKAFSLIESPVFRRMIIQTAREASFCSRSGEPSSENVGSRPTPSATLDDQQD